MLTIYAAFDSSNDNKFITVSTSLIKCAKNVVAYLKTCYGSYEWISFLEEDGYADDEAMVQDIVSGSDDILSRYGVAIQEYEDD